MPGQRIAILTQDLRDLPVAAGITGGFSHLPVCGNLAAWNGTDHLTDGRLHLHGPFRLFVRTTG